MSDPRILVIGAGPAGLAAAWELARAGRAPLLVERAAQPGGIARTECYRGYRFDVGGHRFFTQFPEIDDLVHGLLDGDLLRVPRLSRIYYRGKFFRYPLAAADALAKLGPIEGLRVLGSYLRAKAAPVRPEASLQDWVTNRFGRRLYDTFFAGYTEKVWGVPGHEVSAEWAAQRIRGLSLRTVVHNALTGHHRTRSLITAFDYPRLGPGMLWERMAERVREAGGEVRFGCAAVALRHAGGRVREVVLRSPEGDTVQPVEAVISSLPLPELVRSLEPAPPAPALAAAAGLRFRSLLVACLILERAHLFPDTWIYVHSPAVRVGRIQNFKNWSRELVPDPATTSLGLEYFCSEGDELWRLAHADLLALARRELELLGLAGAAEVRDGTVIRQPKAYPVYDDGYEERVAVIRTLVGGLAGLQTIGRNGMHRYNNQDHSMVTGLLAAQNLLGAEHDLWAVNSEPSYLEEAQAG